MVPIAEYVEGRLWRGVDRTLRDPPHARDDTEDWAELRLPGAAMSDGLVVDTILLVGKGKRDKGRPMEVGEGAVEMVQSPQPDPEYSKIM